VPAASVWPAASTHVSPALPHAAWLPNSTSPLLPPPLLAANKGMLLPLALVAEPSPDSVMAEPASADSAVSLTSVTLIRLDADARGVLWPMRA